MKTARETIHPVLYRDGNCGARLLDIDEGHSRLCDQLTAAIEARDRALTATGPGSGGGCVRCLSCKRCAAACDCTGGPAIETECSCYEITGGHQPGCAFNRPRAAPQTDHRAAPGAVFDIPTSAFVDKQPEGSVEVMPGVFLSPAPATPPSGSPPTEDK